MKTPTINKILLLIFFVVIQFDIIAQNINNDENLKYIFQKPKPKNNYSKYLKENENEFKIIFSFFYLAYKEFISSQDEDVCNFNPSCSTYMIESIKKKGLITGILNGFDRLTRCNPFIKEDYYPKDINTLKYYDPVE
jgi:putative component of membrane protein insertase Oxa1/YidC/SpoIIIJ protein YidD